MKLSKTPLARYFPEYTGKLDSTRAFIDALQSANPIVFLSSHHRWCGYQQSSEIYPLEIHSNEPSSAQYLSPSYASDGHIKCETIPVGMCTPSYLVPHIPLDSAGLCCCKGNYPTGSLPIFFVHAKTIYAEPGLIYPLTERTQRQWNLVRTGRPLNTSGYRSAIGLAMWNTVYNIVGWPRWHVTHHRGVYITSGHKILSMYYKTDGHDWPFTLSALLIRFLYAYSMSRLILEYHTFVFSWRPGTACALYISCRCTKSDAVRLM